MSDSISRTPSFEERFRSFVDWPRWAAQEPRKLARAGFRFRNKHDLVKCDYCGGKFYNWKKEDDPVVEHMKYFPNCLHVASLQAEASNADEEKAPPRTSSPSQPESRPLMHKGRVAAATSCGSERTDSSHGRSCGTKVPVPPVTSDVAKWLRRCMDQTFVQIILAKGYKKTDVKKVLIANRNENKEVSDAVSLVKQIYELEDKEQRTPKAAQNALKSDPSVSSDDGEGFDERPSSGDNTVATESEATYCDPEDDPRCRCPPPKRPREANTTVDATQAKNHGEYLCIVCKKEIKGCLFMPCSHLCTCPNCAVTLSECPSCNRDIMHRLRVHLE